MTFEQDLQAFSAFNIDQAEASLWVFKKRTISGQTNPFTAVAVLMGEALRDYLNGLLSAYQRSHTVFQEYSLLSQSEEGGFLAVATDNTLFPSLKGLIDQPTEECLINNVKQLNNATGYVLRLRQGESVIYCVKKANADWATRKRAGMMNICFTGAMLNIMENPSFSISRNFDFFVSGGSILMVNKAVFESVLNHKVNYEEAYAELKQEQDFAAAISDFAVFDAFIGHNATHLRRMAVVKARGYYRNPQYMARLREISDTRNWGIQFDEEGRIVATPETMRVILHVLLDHRLRSELSENQYDVPSAMQVH